MNDEQSDFCLCFPIYLLMSQSEIAALDGFSFCSYPQTIVISHSDGTEENAIVVFTDEVGAEHFHDDNNEPKPENVVSIPYNSAVKLADDLRAMLEFKPSIRKAVLDPWKMKMKGQAVEIVDLIADLERIGRKESL